jgi:hypothetical protein
MDGQTGAFGAVGAVPGSCRVHQSKYEIITHIAENATSIVGRLSGVSDTQFYFSSR